MSAKSIETAMEAALVSQAVEKRILRLSADMDALREQINSEQVPERDETKETSIQSPEVASEVTRSPSKKQFPERVACIRKWIKVLLREKERKGESYFANYLKSENSSNK